MADKVINFSGSTDDLEGVAKIISDMADSMYQEDLAGIAALHLAEFERDAEAFEWGYTLGVTAALMRIIDNRLVMSLRDEPNKG